MQIRNPYCSPFIKVQPPPDLILTVIIPCYDEPDIEGSLQSLYDCDSINGSVEIIVLINNGVHVSNDIKKQNQQSFEDASLWIKDHQSEDKKFYVKYFDDLPKKHAGVGLARKIAMDEAASRFQIINNLDGIIQCYDADCKCEPNLLQAVIDGFKKHETATLGIHYEHPIEGNQYPQAIYDAIISYELHLRYYTNIQSFIGLPFAFQTIGSSMAVKTKDYILQGGMNKKKAGEDFYFLQKFIQIDRHSEISNTTVIPAPRMSDRVPFGTGKAVNDIIGKDQKAYRSYNPKAFTDLTILLNGIKFLYESENINEDFIHWPKSLISYFIEQEKLAEVIVEIKKHTSNYDLFVKRFFKWFTAFKLMKFLHYCRDEKIIDDIPVIDAAHQFINSFLGITIDKDEKVMLEFFREKDRRERQ